MNQKGVKPNTSIHTRVGSPKGSRWTLARIIKVLAISDSDVGMDMEGLREDLSMPDRREKREEERSGADKECC